METPDIEIDCIDHDALTINFWNKGISMMFMNEEAKELRDALIEALSV